jgi:RNA polymerase sporulation-specific sigma factor
VIFFRDLVYKIRASKNPIEINDCFLQIVDKLEVKIKKIAGRFRIPGATFEDVYQEALIALKFKAIKDYDETRNPNCEGPAPFDRFALLCIRRHLATTLKTSHQNSKKVLNTYVPFDSSVPNSNNALNDLSLANILTEDTTDILDAVQNKEYFRTLFQKLLAKLSSLEKRVFFLYAQQYSYEEIAEIITKQNQQKGDNKIVDYKGVDNSLSRLKTKAASILNKFEKNNGK